MDFVRVDEATKYYAYDYEDYECKDKSGETLIEEILKDPEFQEIKALEIGDWGGAWEDDCQALIDGIVENKERFSHIERLFMGDMDFESCEVSWIMQGNYSKLWDAMPQLKSLTIKGSLELELGDICHEGLEELTIICGGLPKYVIESIRDAKLPNLKKLLLYLGVDDYGFDGDVDTIKDFLEKSDFPKLTYLGLTDSEIQDEIAEVVVESKYMGQLETLDLSMGSFSDKGAELLLQKLPLFPNIKILDVHYNYLTDKMVRKLEMFPIDVDASENNKPDEYGGQIYMIPMLTE